jgi:hypothetical protein
MFSSKEAEKKMSTGGGTSKVIQPGTVEAKLLDLKLEVPPYDSNVYNLILNLETAPIGGDFEGLPVNKDNPELGKYAGQVANVQAQQFSFSDYTNSMGKTTTKSDAIFRWIWNFAKAIGVSEQLVANDIKGDTIEEYVENVKPYLISGERYIYWCIGGVEYENKAGYTQYRLFVVKPQNGKNGYALSTGSDKPSSLITFDESVHIRRKKPSEAVASFEGRDSSSDLDLD